MATRTRRANPVVDEDDLDDEAEEQDQLGDQVDHAAEAANDMPSHVKVKSQKPSRVIKYMGSADRRRLSKGETILGNLGEKDALGEDLEWHSADGHLLVADEHSGVSDAFWNELVKLDDFKDVTEAYNDPSKKVPKNVYDAMWRLKNDNTGGI